MKRKGDKIGACKGGWGGSLTDPTLCREHSLGSWMAFFSSGYESQGQRLLRCPPGQPPDFTEDPKVPGTRFQTPLQHLLRSLSCVVGVPVPEGSGAGAKGAGMSLAWSPARRSQGAGEDQVPSWNHPQKPFIWIKSSCNPQLISSY